MERPSHCGYRKRSTGCPPWPRRRGKTPTCCTRPRCSARARESGPQRSDRDNNAFTRRFAEQPCGASAWNGLPARQRQVRSEPSPREHLRAIHARLRARSRVRLAGLAAGRRVGHDEPAAPDYGHVTLIVRSLVRMAHVVRGGQVAAARRLAVDEERGDAQEEAGGDGKDEPAARELRRRSGAEELKQRRRAAAEAAEAEAAAAERRRAEASRAAAAAESAHACRSSVFMAKVRLRAPAQQARLLGSPTACPWPLGGPTVQGPNSLPARCVQLTFMRRAAQRPSVRSVGLAGFSRLVRNAAQRRVWRLG